MDKGSNLLGRPDLPNWEMDFGVINCSGEVHPIGVNKFPLTWLMSQMCEIY